MNLVIDFLDETNGILRGTKQLKNYLNLLRKLANWRKIVKSP